MVKEPGPVFSAVPASECTGCDTVLIDSKSASGGGRKNLGQNGGAGIRGNLQSDLEPLFAGKWEEGLVISE